MKLYRTKSQRKTQARNRRAWARPPTNGGRKAGPKARVTPFFSVAKTRVRTFPWFRSYH